MTALESTILAALLAGDRHDLGVLREQIRSLTVRDREYTGVGFFTYFTVPPDTARLVDRSRLVISDVGADIEQLEHGAGFLLFVEDGAVDCLEGFTYDEPWPPDAIVRRWYYLRHRSSASAELIETADRDLNRAVSKRPG
jgi:hypothetical protein